MASNHPVRAANEEFYTGAELLASEFLVNGTNHVAQGDSVNITSLSLFLVLYRIPLLSAGHYRAPFTTRFEIDFVIGTGDQEFTVALTDGTYAVSSLVAPRNACCEA